MKLWVKPTINELDVKMTKMSVRHSRQVISTNNIDLLCNDSNDGDSLEASSSSGGSGHESSSGS